MSPMHCLFRVELEQEVRSLSALAPAKCPTCNRGVVSNTIELDEDEILLTLHHGAPKDLDASPLVEAIEHQARRISTNTQGHVDIEGFIDDDVLRRNYYRIKDRGTVGYWLADRMCVEVLGTNLYTIWPELLSP